MRIRSEIIDVVAEKVSRLRDETVQLRRGFHQYPELSWKETKTAEKVMALLRDIGLKVQNGICGTGVVAEIEGKNAGKTVAIRADMDALPIQDSKDTLYASRVPGVMHACGHDCHMAIAVGVAKILHEMRDRISGIIRLIFQPSEEAFPSGAQELVNADVMKGVDSIFALHVDPEIAVGKIGLRKGLLTANASEFKVAIFGKSGHAARPHQSIDTIHIATQILTALYDTVVKRSQSHLPAVVTVGKVVGGTKSNVIPDRVDISGTIRSVDRRTSAEMQQLIENRVAAITRSADARYEIEFPSLIPSVKNDASLVDLIRDVSLSFLGDANILDIANISMGGEDFSWFLNEAPGVLIRLGARRIGDEVRYLHTDSFDIDEAALSTGMQVMALAVLEFLST